MANEILKHFRRTNESGYITYHLDKTQWQQFVDQLFEGFRVCYITDEALAESCNILGMTSADVLRNYLPDEPTIMSGDFGELLCYHVALENATAKGITFTGPKKWLWKDNRNKAAPGADVLLFHRARTDGPSQDDILLTIESKMKSVTSKKHPMQDAIEGAVKDKHSRMVKTLAWLKEKYVKLNDPDSIRAIERFRDPIVHGAFKSQQKAIAIVDSTLETEETSKTIDNEEGVVVILFLIDDLKQAYEQTIANILKSV
jgi:hypothetical protein